MDANRSLASLITGDRLVIDAHIGDAARTQMRTELLGRQRRGESGSGGWRHGEGGLELENQ
ncbi:MAG: hypothetical protein B7Z14_15280 [Bosea sp. 32-68-6]|nr:MAG: hypothetical protein B7Z14_15280 [Bosea sp. 32-68-6]